ncbi:uncharacterized protein C8Q71DRAFT_198533 [Rhodofomes roseus]|uniref:Uncharacterized protein n=1 Tax=Rhodofomes roseus TaxID=34475 RepID=A0ABQ8K933_9APHY|nr:uncharacterized protein C8Q71DRAFT_198533 [Rhodofomes roseus]KAH9833340.1 hypothetical protein C8Q71DRAFT_198533 [Rhodofomes roseus]
MQIPACWVVLDLSTTYKSFDILVANFSASGSHFTSVVPFLVRVFHPFFSLVTFNGPLLRMWLAILCFLASHLALSACAAPIGSFLRVRRDLGWVLVSVTVSFTGKGFPTLTSASTV